MEDQHLLSGIRVLDCGTFIAGPAAATVMADFGADVIKVEPPGAGDPYRNLYRLPGMPDANVDYPWILDNRNKRSIALDLKVDEGRNVLLELVRSADVFVTNFPPQVRERLGIRYCDLSNLNERLVYASLSGYGEDGAEANRPGYDATAWWARSGLMDLVRNPENPPAGSMPGMGDHPTAIAMYGAIMTALYRRERTGKGSKVSTSLLANGAWSNAILIQSALTGSRMPERLPREKARNALTNLYQSGDKRWFMLALVREEKLWPRLADAIGKAELLNDPRFSSMDQRHAHSVELVRILDEIFATKSWVEWEPRLREREITYAVVDRLQDVPNDPQMLASGTFRALQDPRAGADKVVDSPIWVEGAEKVDVRLAPSLGEHTEEVLREAGYDADTITRLRDARAIA